MVTLGELEEVKRVQAQTGRIYSVYYSEHFTTPATIKAGELVSAGAIGRVVHTIGLGPHRLNRPLRPGWFFERARYGGILTDIASHQCEQFLFFTGASDARVRSASVANRNNPDTPELQDFGEMLLETEGASGYIRVDWFTPDGLPTWGDGRIMLLGTEGYIELRKYVDIAGRPGADHLFLVDGKGMQYIDCSSVRLTYGRDLIRDVIERSQSVMPQERCFKAMELALRAQALAESGN
jgi:predicted dehydrogenase